MEHRVRETLFSSLLPQTNRRLLSFCFPNTLIATAIPMNKKYNHSNSSICILMHSIFCRDEKQKPNVVFIIVDDLNDWIGVMGGHPQSKTPNLDALAEDGVLFTNAHCNAPQCGPSLESLLHGLYPKSTGRYFNSPKRMPFYGDQPTQGITSPNAPKNPFVFHQHFKEHGYRVVSGGKVAHGNLKRNHEQCRRVPGSPS